MESKTTMKSNLFSFLSHVPAIDGHVIAFWKNHKQKINEWYLDRNVGGDIFVSASPEFLLKPIAEELGIRDVVATRMSKTNGKINGLNCHGEEKVRRVSERYPDQVFAEAYGDSPSDIPLLRMAAKQYMIKQNKPIEVQYD